jgi:AcrR family transcriptional regulator
MPKIVDHKARRLELSEVAARLIASGGLEAATIREIAKASGYSKGVVEHYFDNKEELISGALAWANRCYEQRVEEATAGLSGLAALKNRIEATLPMDEIIRVEWRVRLVFWSMAAIYPELREQQARRLQMAVEFYDQDIVAAIAAGEVPDQDDTTAQARHLLNMTTGISTATLHNTALYDRAFLEQEIDYLLNKVSLGNF